MLEKLSVVSPPRKFTLFFLFGERYFEVDKDLNLITPPTAFGEKWGMPISEYKKSTGVSQEGDKAFFFLDDGTYLEGSIRRKSIKPKKFYTKSKFPLDSTISAVTKINNQEVVISKSTIYLCKEKCTSGYFKIDENFPLPEDLKISSEMQPKKTQEDSRIVASILDRDDKFAYVINSGGQYAKVNIENGQMLSDYPKVLPFHERVLGGFLADEGFVFFLEDNEHTILDYETFEEKENYPKKLGHDGQYKIDENHVMTGVGKTEKNIALFLKDNKYLQVNNRNVDNNPKNIEDLCEGLSHELGDDTILNYFEKDSTQFFFTNSETLICRDNKYIRRININFESFANQVKVSL